MNLINNCMEQVVVEWENCSNETRELCDRVNIPRDTLFKTIFGSISISIGTFIVYSIQGTVGVAGLTILPAIGGFVLIGVLATLTYAVAVAILRKCNYQTIPWPVHFLISAVCITGAFLITGIVLPQFAIMSLAEIILIAIIALLNTGLNRVLMNQAGRCPLDRCAIFVI